MIRLLIDTILFRRRCRNCHWYVGCSRTCARKAFTVQRTTMFHPDCRGCRDHSWIWSWW